MGADAPENETGRLQEELRLVDSELTSLRDTVADLRSKVGARSDGTTDPAETAAVIASAEEQEALIGVLESRRESLLRQLA